MKRSFYNQHTEKVAKALLGCYLINKTKSGIAIGKIVETEAYLSNDPASHSYNGKTKRNEAMFGQAGTAYIYFTYGMHHCFNVVTRPKGIGEAVLIRSLEPISGIELMKRRRKTDEVRQLCTGPAKLVQALEISKKQNGIDLINSSLKISNSKFNIKLPVIRTTRVGISKGTDLKLRFYIKDNNFVSKR